VAFILGPEDAELLQAAWWEPTRIRYGLGREYFDVDPADMERGSGAWVHPLQILNRPQPVPSTGEKRPVELHELESLQVADGETFDQRTLVASTRDVVELRLPWALLGFADPSSLKLVVQHPQKPTSTQDAGPIGLAVVAGDDPVLTPSPYGWEPWQEIAWHERRKAGFDDLADTFRDLAAAP
jgi:hypothetical protein